VEVVGIGGQSPRVSICIPTVSQIDFFREAVASVAAQTWTDFEVVVGDNSGNQEYQRKVDEVLAEFSDLRFVLKRHPTRIDAIQNANSMLEESRGEFWVFLADDDRVRPTFFARSVEALDSHPECTFTFADHWIIRADGTVDEAASHANSVRFLRVSLKEGVYEHQRLFGLALRQSLCLQTAMFRKSVIGSFGFMPGVMAGDYSLFMRIVGSGPKHNAYYVDERVFDYRIHGAQLTTTMDRTSLLRASIAALEGAVSVPSEYLREFRRKLGRQYLALALLEAEDGNLPVARSHAATGLRHAISARTVLGTVLVNVAPFAIGPARRLYETARLLRSPSPHANPAG
jgi:glycosyltransferase involved in cell wall biosynthesis